MVFQTWHEAVASLKKATGPVTDQQKALGRLAGVTLPEKIPRLVAAAILKTALGQDLDLPPPQPVNDGHLLRIEILSRPSNFEFAPENDIEAGAWINFLRLARRQKDLADLKILAGDVIETKDGEIAQVSSIGEDGRIYLKGGNGFGSWPDQISVVARVSDESKRAVDARHDAKNTAALRATRFEWTAAKSQDLPEFIIKDRLEVDDVTELESVILGAKDERPIQKFLEDHRHLLTALLVGKERYCLPQKRLGGELVPDFIIGDGDLAQLVDG